MSFMDIQNLCSKAKRFLAQKISYFSSVNFYRNRSERIHDILPYSWLDDKYWLEFYFLKHFGFKLNLQDPITLNQKFNWMKLFDRNPLYTILSDKYRVREYVKQKIGSEYLNQLYGVYDTPEQIEWDKLPPQYVIKPNHGAGWVIINDGSGAFEQIEAITKLDEWLNINFYKYFREWQYKNIKPRILVEAKINPTSDLGLIDYKFFCFDGEPHFVQVNVDRFTNLALLFFDMEWNQLPLSLEKYPRSTKVVPKPTNFSELLQAARRLSEGLSFCRVDLYDENGKIIFGEITLTPNAGVKRFEPPEFDLEFGKLLNLRKIKWNPIRKLSTFLPLKLGK